MNKRAGAFVGACALALAVAGCGTTSGSGGGTTSAGGVAAFTPPKVPMKQSMGKMEGQVNILAWPGYAEDGSNDPKVDWVTPFEKATGCKANVKYFGTSSCSSTKGKTKFLPISDRQVKFQRGSAADCLYRWLAWSGEADYTGGFAYTLNDDAPVGPRWLARALDWIDDALRVPRAGSPGEPRAFEIGVQLFTPRDLTAEEALPDDRPYANLVYASSSSIARDDARDVVRQTTFTICVLGLPIIGDLHRALHELLNSPLPNGYAHQISDGGEPTFRYAFSSQHLLASGTLGERPYSARFGVTANAGYLTDASAEIAMRSGPERVPWWSAPPPSIGRLTNV